MLEKLVSSPCTYCLFLDPAFKVCVSILKAMPLWSNEEWRARIGSCWSALGRPGKSATSPGNRYDYLVLSGRTMLQAVCVLLTLILVQGIKSINGCVSGCQRQLSESK